MKLRWPRPIHARTSAACLLCAFLALVVTGSVEQHRVMAQNQGAPLAVKRFSLTTPSEIGLEIDARAPAASWAKAGAEAPALTISVNGKYNQDLILWAGDHDYTYRLALGRLPRGRHTIAIRLNEPRGAPGARRAQIKALRTIAAAAGADADDLLALAYSPILYARANTIDRFTDLPLLMYYEIESEPSGDKLIRYSTIFTHEDGGTPAVALMSRWGRMTDIEWTYELRLRGRRIVAETFQGIEHETKPFRGERALGSHPLLATASDNNNFSDLASSVVRFALLPTRVRLSASSREIVMDERPEIYRVMAEELQREKRIAETPSGVNVIADPRRYLYLEGYAEQQGTTIAFEVQQKQNLPLSSDHGDPRLRIERSGYFRSTILLPAGAVVDNISLRCHARTDAAPGGSCHKVKLNKVFLLNADYTPQPLKFEASPDKSLAPGQAVTYRINN